jgi:nucleoside-diphosphate-sugar epimerase
MATDVVLVTGGNGCLGQHVVRLLHEKADHVREIRVLDRVPYRNRLGTFGDRLGTFGDILVMCIDRLSTCINGYVYL